MASSTYLCLYCNDLQALGALSDSECGRLIKACLKYTATGEETKLPGNERFLWPMFKNQVDRDCDRRAAYLQKQREIGSKGGRPTKGVVHPKKGLGFSKSLTSTSTSTSKERQEKERFCPENGLSVENSVENCEYPVENCGEAVENPIYPVENPVKRVSPPVESPRFDEDAARKRAIAMLRRG